MKDKQLILDQYAKYGFTLLESLGTSSTQRYRTLCKCGNEFMSRPYDVKTDKVKSCGHCNDPIVGTRMGSIEVMIYIPDKANGCRVVCQCECGMWLPMMSGGRFNSGQIKSCGHCNDPKVGERYGKLVIREVIPARHKGCKIICDCDCGGTYGPIKSTVVANHRLHVQSCGKCADIYIGKKFGKLTVEEVISYNSGGGSVNCKCNCGTLVRALRLGVLTNGNTTSCGFCQAPKVGDKHGKLTVVSVDIDRSTGTLNVATQCDCGKEYTPHHWGVISSGNTKSCGNCYNLRNGKFTSFMALELHDMIEDIVGHSCEHNYYIDGKCFDIVDVQNKIIIEYDEYYWHRTMRDTSSNERKETRLAIKNGYQILRIRASDDLPTKEQLEKVITNHFQHDAKQHTITTPGWKQAAKCNKTLI